MRKKFFFLSSFLLICNHIFAEKSSNNLYILEETHTAINNADDSSKTYKNSLILMPYYMKAKLDEFDMRWYWLVLSLENRITSKYKLNLSFGEYDTRNNYKYTIASSRIKNHLLSLNGLYNLLPTKKRNEFWMGISGVIYKGNFIATWDDSSIHYFNIKPVFKMGICFQYFHKIYKEISFGFFSFLYLPSKLHYQEMNGAQSFNLSLKYNF